MQPAPNSDLAFHTADYVVFVLFLLGFSAVGVWTGIRGIIRQAKLKPGQQKALGSQRELSVIAVSFSLLASLFTAPILLGSPAEIYLHGSDYIFIVFGYLLGAGFATHFIHRRMYNLKLTSVYEYFELRFSFVVRIAGVLIFMLMTLVVLASTIYGPGLILSEVMGLPLEVSVILVGLLGTVYITIGGLKGVVWVDVFQMLLVLAMSIAILSTGTAEVDGIERVFNVSIQGGRLNVPEINPNPLLRMSVWTQTIGGAVSIACLYSTQFIAQKTLALPSLKLVYSGSVVGVLLSDLYIILGCLIGLVMYTYNFLCDPISEKKVNNPDQLLPYFVMQLFHSYPGIPGLFVAAAIGATLSAVGSGVNALAALTMLNIVSPMYKKKHNEDLFETRPFIAALILKIITAIWGVFTVVAAYVASIVNKELMQLFFSFLGVLPGPLFGTFVLGIFFPFANHWGALTGLLSSLGVVTWLFLGAITSGVARLAGAPYPLIDSCPNGTLSDYTWEQLNSSGWITTREENEHYYHNLTSGLDYFYGISFMYYGVVAVLVNVVLGLLVSLLTNLCDKRYNVNPKLGYLWWLEAAEAELDAHVEKQTELINKAQSIQNLMTLEAKIVTTKLTSENSGAAQRKESHKLKRISSSQSVQSLKRSQSSDPCFVIQEATEEDDDEGIVWNSQDGSEESHMTYNCRPQLQMSDMVIAEGVWYKL